MNFDPQRPLELGVDISLVDRVYDYLRHGEERLLAVCTCQGWGFEVMFDRVLLLKLINGLGRNFSLFFEVGFIANQANPQLSMRVTLYFFEPEIQGIKRSFGSKIEDHEGSDWTSVVGPGDAPVVLLSRGVPDLNLDSFFIDLYHLSSKLNPEGGFMLIFEPVLQEPQEQAAFAHSYSYQSKVPDSPTKMNLNR